MTIFLKWNQMTHCLDRIGFLKKFDFRLILWWGESHRLFTVASLTLITTRRRGERESFKNSRLSRLSPLFPHLFNLNRFDIASTMPWQTATLFCVSDVTSFTTKLCCSFSTFETTHFLQSFFSLLSSFSLVPSCCFYPSCTLVHDPNTIESYKYVISPVSS